MVTIDIYFTGETWPAATRVSATLALSIGILAALQAAGFAVYTDWVEGKNLWSLLDNLNHIILIPFTRTELLSGQSEKEQINVIKDQPKR